jgi:hypothetical protein
LATLAAIWLDSPDCLCHYSDTNDLLSGYDNIIAYFETIVPSKAQSEIIDVKLQFMGDVAIVSSEIKYNLPKTSGSSNHSPDKDTRKYFTNVFVRSHVSDRFQLLTQLSSSQETIHPHHSVYRDPTILPPKRKSRSRTSPINDLRGLNFLSDAFQQLDDEDDEDDTSNNSNHSPEIEFSKNSLSSEELNDDDEEEDDESDELETLSNSDEAMAGLRSKHSLRNQINRAAVQLGESTRIIPQKDGFVVVTPLNKEAVIRSSSETSGNEEVNRLRETLAKAIREKLSSASENYRKRDSNFGGTTERNIEMASDPASFDNMLKTLRQGVLNALVSKGLKSSSPESTQISEHQRNYVERCNDNQVNEDDYDDDSETNSKLQRERRLVSAASESLITWLESNYHAQQSELPDLVASLNDSALPVKLNYSLFSLTPTEASRLRTDLIAAATRAMPSKIDTAFTMLLCRRKPRYLEGEIYLSLENVPHTTQHFIWLSHEHSEDMIDLLRLWKRHVRDISLPSIDQMSNGSVSIAEETVHEAANIENHKPLRNMRKCK